MKSILAVLFFILAMPTYAQKHYILGIQKVTFRTGPGTDSKIIKMMEAETPVTIIEVDEKWTKVKDSEGKEGYILSRFLTPEIPYTLRYNWLKKKYNQLQTKNNKVKKDFDDTKELLKKNEEQLLKITQELSLSKKSFEELKTGSANFLKLQTNYKEMKSRLNKQSLTLVNLENKLSKHYIYWFLAGAGVLILGWIIGVAFRKKGRSSQLSF